MIADSNAYTLKIGGTNTRLSAASAWPSLPLALRTLGNRKIGAVHLVLLKVLAEVLSVVAVKQFLSVTSGSSSWGFSRHLQWCLPSCGSAIVLWQHVVLPLFKCMMVMTRVTLVLTR